MPELPDLTAYLEALAERAVGAKLEELRWLSPFVLRSVDPPAAELVGRTLCGVERLGKRLVFAFDGERFVVVHLMIAGRLLWKSGGAKAPGRIALAELRFSTGALFLTEAGTKKRASIHLVSGRDALAGHDPGGIEPLATAIGDFRAALRRENRTLKRALTDPGLVAGIGNAYSDEILHAARLSPLARTHDLRDEAWTRLHGAVREVLALWVDRLRRERSGGFPARVTAFRPEMAVHGRFGQACPRCGDPVQRIVYAENEANYCATCQTGGKLLADRVLSQLMKSDWPRSLEELEERKSRGRRAALATVVAGALLLAAVSGQASEPKVRPPSGLELTLPLPSRAADPERLAAARALLGPDGRSRALGPYGFLSDVDDARLLARAAHLAATLESSYSERYGLVPVGKARESTILFARESDYRAFQRSEPRLAEMEAASGLAGSGLVATYTGDRSADEILATLAHEWVHLLNRRAIGPALPSWLEEGTADDLASATIDDAGRLRLGSWSRILTPRPGGWKIAGGEAALRELALVLAPSDERLDLETVLKLAWSEFAGSDRAPLHYAAASSFLRWILADEGLRPRARAWLAEVAAGAPAELEGLRAELGLPWAEIEPRWSHWVAAELAGLPPLPVPDSGSD